MDTAPHASEHGAMRHDAGIAPRPDWEPLRRPAGREVWEAQLLPLALWIAQRRDELAEAIADRVEPELPSDEQVPWTLGGDGAAMLRASVRAGLRLFAERLEHGEDPTTIELPAATVAFVRESARRGVPMASLMRIYRLLVAALWRELAQHLTERAPGRQELGAAVELCSAWMFTYVDRAQERAESLFVAERELWLRSAAAAQAETIDAILDTRLSDTLVAGQRLRYALDRQHVGVLAWVDPDDDAEPMARLHAAVGGLREAAGAEGALVRPLGEQATTAWMSRVTPFDDDALDALSVDPVLAPGVQIALGDPGAGLEGFRRTHRQTLHARRVAQMAGRSGGQITRYGRVALCALATSDLEHAREFVQRELGELADGDDATVRLAATLRIYLEEHSSRAPTARRLGIHENTVSYRVRRAEQILGRSITERTLELRIALLLASTMPERRVRARSLPSPDR
jgi:DNA-binding PucR family transcriptional regulator